MNPWLNMRGVSSRTNSGWASGGASIGGAVALPPGASFGPMTAANVPRPPRNPFARQEYLPQNQEEENPFGPDEEPQRRPIRGYSQSQGAQRTRTGPLSPRTSYTPTSMLPRSQRYSR